MIVVVAPASMVLEHIVDFVGVAVGEEVAVNADIPPKRATKAVYFTCGFPVLCRMSHLGFVILHC